MKKHATLKITTDQHLVTNGLFDYQLEMDGCRSCLQKAITQLMVSNDTVRELFNAAGREANRIRQEQRQQRDN